MTEKKWKIVLLCFYHHFKNRREPITPRDLFDYRYRFLRDNGVLTEGAAQCHTRRLAKRGYLYSIYDRSKPVHYGIPRCYLLSKAGIERLAYEELIPEGEAKRLLPHIHHVADEARSSIKYRRD